MILSFTLIFVALAILFLLLYLEGGHNSSLQQLDDLAGKTRPVDLEAFRNLVDPGEEDFLHSNLLPRQFRTVQRERMRAALEYVQNASHNAAFLLRMGEAAARNPEPWRTKHTPRAQQANASGFAGELARHASSRRV